MTNKRARREATGPSQEGTSRSARVQRHPPQGMSEGALAWMATPRQHTNCQPERGMQLVPVEYPEIWNALLGHHWEGFVKDRQRFDPQLVKEFYACWCDIRDNGRVPIRGKLVEFTPARINRFYEIPEPTPDIEILRLDDGTPITQEEASVLAHPGFILNFEADFIPYTELVLEARIWTHFIQHSMTPSTSYKRLYRNRAKIVHAIMIGKYIDVGSVIVDEFKTVRGDHKSGLAFPCLITALCTAAGVPTASRAALEKPKGPMTRVTTAAIRRTMGAEAEAARLDREAGQEPANEDDEELEGHPEQAQQPVQQIEAGHIFSWDQMREYMDSQFRDLRRDMNKGFDALDGRMKSLEERFPPRSPRGPQ